MKKRILSVILCLAMVAGMLAIPAAAIDLSAETIEPIADNSSYTCLAQNSSASTYFYFGEMTENCTITLYYMPAETYLDDIDANNFWLVDSSAEDKILGGLASGYKAPCNGGYLFMRTAEQNEDWFDCTEAENVQALKLGEWNRLDLVVDFENKTVTGYVNYNLLETVDFMEGAEKFDAIQIPAMANGYRACKRAWMDNLVITKGLNAPEQGDLAHLLTAEKIAENKDEYIFVETFDTTTSYKTGENTKTPGDVCMTNSNPGFGGIDATVGMCGPRQITDYSCYTALVQNSGAATYIYFDEITEDATVTFYYMPCATYDQDQDAHIFNLVDTDAEAADVLLGGFSSGYKAPCSGCHLFMRTAEQNHNWFECAGAENVQPLKIGQWNRLDLVIDYENKTVTGYVNYKLLETVDFMEGAEKFDAIQIPALFNGYRPLKRAYIDNLIITKGLNTPAEDDIAVGLTGMTLAMNEDKILHVETFDETTSYKTGENTKTPGDVCMTNSNPGFGGITNRVGMTANTVVKTIAPKPDFVIDDTTSMTMLVPNSSGQYRIYLGEITESATLTWYINTSEDYATTQDGFWYKLYDGDTFVGGWESNPWGGLGKYLHMNTATADQGEGWSGYAAPSLGEPGLLKMAEWNRVDLVVDYENHTISGYVNYNLVQTLDLGEDVTSFDHLKIGGYQNGFKANKRIYMDNLMLREGAVAPAEDDSAATATVTDDVLLFIPFNADTEIVHGTSVETFEAGKIYNFRADGNTGFCSLTTTVGLEGNWKAPETFTVTWVIDGVETTEEYAYGATPTAPEIPAKDADAQYTYGAGTWDKDVIAVQEDVTYTATWAATLNKYTVTWVIDGVETTEEVAYGTVPTAPEIPEKEADAQYTYGEGAWDKEIVAVTGDVTYTAVYATTTNKYTVTWIIDGEETTEEVEYGAVPTAPTNTDKAADETYTYTFTGWDKEIAAVTGDVTYTAQYSQTEIAQNTTTVDPGTTKAPDTTDAPVDGTDAPVDGTDAPKADDGGCGSCGSVSLGAIIALAVGMFGLGFTVIKKK